MSKKALLPNNKAMLLVARRRRSVLKLLIAKDVLRVWRAGPGAAAAPGVVATPAPRGCAGRRQPGLAR